MTVLFDPTTAVVLTRRSAHGTRSVDAEPWLKYLTVAAVASHALGLIVVNMYLVPFGVSEPDLLRPRYAMTGAVLLMTLALATTVPLFVWRMTLMFVVGKDNRLRDRLRAILSLGLLVAASLAFFDALVPFGYSIGVAAFVLTGTIGVVVVNLLKMAADPEWTKYRPSPKRPRNPEVTGITKHVARVYTVLLAVIMLTLYVAMYTATVFPFLSESLGGGRGPRAQFVLDPLGGAALKAAGVTLTGPDGNVTPRVRVLFSGSRTYILNVPGVPRSVVILDKERVVASL